ncbi:MAG TPA: nickel-dependent lactate racemase [Pyrinomonadaceae bacterium]|nr:nickel-dependent lactate racemase [Pyrinomonadaceae bacterium]
MSEIELRYGKSSVPFRFLEDDWKILESEPSSRPLSDVDINLQFDQAGVDDSVAFDESVLIVVPDATRKTGAGQIANLLVRRLVQNGTTPDKIRIIFATGIHRKVTPAERDEILTPFVAQRIKLLDHDARDLAGNVRLGVSSRGIPIELNRALIEHDRVIIVGGISFHYFAGFTGGRKLICPGLASATTIRETHKLAFDTAILSRREGVGPALLDGNAVHEAFVEATEFRPPDLAISTIVNSDGDITDIFCGDWKQSHREACDEFAQRSTVEISDRRDVVIASCGGSPFDVNMIQAHKALEAATTACTPGGKIVLIAQCVDGLGRSDFLDWFDCDNSYELAVRLSERYQVNGQTAWNLMRRCEEFDVFLMSELPDDVVRKMRMKPLSDLSDITESSGFVLPQASKLLIKKPQMH